MAGCIFAAVLIALAFSPARAEPVDLTSGAFRHKVAQESWYRVGQAIERLAEEHVRVSATINGWLDDIRAENKALRERCGRPCADIAGAQPR